MSEKQITEVDATEPLKELMDELPVAVYTTDAQGIIDYYNKAASELWGTNPQLGKDKWCGTHRIYKTDGTYLPHEDCPMGVAIRENKRVRGASAIGERPDGTRFTFTPYPTPIRNFSGHLIGGINMLVDTSKETSPEKDYAVIKKDLDLQVESLTKLHQLSGFLMQSQDVSASLEAILKTLVGLHQAQFGMISVYDEVKGELCPKASLGFTEEALKKMACVIPDLRKGVCGTAFALKTRVIVEDIDEDLCFLQYREIAKEIGFYSVHSTPVFARNGDIMGVATVHFSQKRQPNKRELQIADMCARYVGQVLTSFKRQTVTI